MLDCLAPTRRAITSPRVLLFSLKFLGWLTARAPESGLRLLAVVLGDGIFFLLPRRRRLVLSNLHHAFPEKPASWHRRIGRESCRRLIETGLLSLATPYLAEDRLRTLLTVSPELLAVYGRHATDPAATLICSPHIAYWETQTAQPLLIPGTFPEFGIIFRPLDNPTANAFVVGSRERFGMKLLSRKTGFAEALKILRRQGFVGVLFDQNAGLQGALTTLFGRVCSTTELPGLMAEKFSARVFGIYPRRLGFWRVEIGCAPIAHDNSSTGVTLALNRWLGRTQSGAVEARATATQLLEEATAEELSNGSARFFAGDLQRSVGRPGEAHRSLLGGLHRQEPWHSTALLSAKMRLAAAEAAPRADPNVPALSADGDAFGAPAYDMHRALQGGDEVAIAPVRARLQGAFTGWQLGVLARDPAFASLELVPAGEGPAVPFAAIPPPAAKKESKGSPIP